MYVGCCRWVLAGLFTLRPLSRAVERNFTRAGGDGLFTCWGVELRLLGGLSWLLWYQFNLFLDVWPVISIDNHHYVGLQTLSDEILGRSFSSALSLASVKDFGRFLDTSQGAAVFLLFVSHSFPLYNELILHSGIFRKLIVKSQCFHELPWLYIAYRSMVRWCRQTEVLKENRVPVSLLSTTNSTSNPVLPRDRRHTVWATALIVFL